jgi:hypothetical protein
MRWPEASRLIDRIKRERPELTVAHYGSDTQYFLRIACLRKGAGPNDLTARYHLVPDSLDTIYGPDGWTRYKQAHPEPWCRPEEAYHTNALGQEVDHRGRVISREAPAAPRISAEDMLSRLVMLSRSNSDWWKDTGQIADLAAAWGVRTKNHGVMADYEAEEVARLSSDVHASILIARTGSGLYASGYAARWGGAGAHLEPSVGSVPYDTEYDARRAAYRDLIDTLQAGRGAARDQQRMLLLAAVKQKDRERGLFG